MSQELQRHTKNVLDHREDRFLGAWLDQDKDSPQPTLPRLCFVQVVGLVRVEILPGSGWESDSAFSASSASLDCSPGAASTPSQRQ